MRSYQMTEGADGTWTAEEVAPGEYLLTINLGQPSADGNFKPAAKAEVPLNLPTGSAEPFDAGEITLQPAE
jgi:hypothetical protein